MKAAAGAASAPRGREAVKEALLESAAALFAEQGIARVSVRDIAARARVNHGLVHRHFGTKEELVRAVMEKLAGELACVSRQSGETATSRLLPLMGALGDSRYVRVLARALLDGAEVPDLQVRFPVVGAMLDAAQAARESGDLREEVDPKMAVAITVALGLGWLHFERFVIASVGLEGSPEALRAELATTMLGMFLAPRATAARPHSRKRR